jgi:anti-sigma factor RsiW
VNAWLAAHPEEAADWELDLALSARLRGLPPKPLPSNFTARVLEQVELERRQAERAGRRGWWNVPILRRIALTGGLAAAAVISSVQYQINQRQQMFHSVVVLSDAATVPDMAWLKDFDSIVRLGQVPPADDELLEALK